MPNYQNGKIYMIESLEGKCRYYGSTVQELCKRMSKHKSNYKKNKYVSSSKVLCFNDAKIFLVENYPCNNKEELNRKEGEYIRNNDCVNRNIPGRTQKEYQQDNKDKISKRTKKKYRENKEQVLKDRKEYYKKNKIKVNKRVNKYYQNNKETRINYAKDYRTKNNDKLTEQRKIKKQCECGTYIRQFELARHRKSKKHMKLMEKNNL